MAWEKNLADLLDKNILALKVAEQIFCPRPWKSNGRSLTYQVTYSRNRRSFTDFDYLWTNFKLEWKSPKLEPNSTFHIPH